MITLLAPPAASVALAVALALAALVVLATTHRRRALFSSAGPSRNVPTPARTLPLLGDAFEVVRNRHRLHDWLLETTLALSKDETERENHRQADANADAEAAGAAGVGPQRHDGRAQTAPASPSRALLPRTWAFTTPFNPIYLVISSPAALEHVLSSRGMQTYVKGPEFSARLGQLLGNGIFCADGEAWRWQRKLAAHAFSAAQFRSHVASAFAVSLEHLFGALEPRARASAAADAASAAAGGGSAAARGGSGEGEGGRIGGGVQDLDDGAVVDLHALMYDLTLDTFSRIGFGVELGLLEAAAAEARGAGAGSAAAAGRIINGVSGREFARAFDQAQRIANRRFWLPLWRLCELVLGDAARVRADVAVVRAFAQGIVRQRRLLLAKAAAAAAGLPEGGGGGGGGGGGEPNGGGGRPDLLALFMRPGALASSAAARFGGEEGAALNHGDGGDAKGNGSSSARELTDAEVVDACLNFIIAARDTTAQATSWAFYELARHPAAEARLLAEAEAVLGAAAAPLAAAEGAAGPANTPGGGAPDLSDRAQTQQPQPQQQQQPQPQPQPQRSQQHPTYDQIRQLRYARAVFLESVRLHPSVPQDCKFALRDDALPDGTPVPRGALVLYSPYVVCRLPALWGADAGEFRPERWLKEEEEGAGGEGGGEGGAGGPPPAKGFLAPSPYAFPAFNAGPRLCLGRGFAELEGVYALVGTLRRYRFALLVGGGEEGGGVATYEQSTSLPILGGLRVRVTRR